MSLSAPEILPYLHADADRKHGGLDSTLEVLLSSQSMRARGMPPARLSRANLSGISWTAAQMLAPHAGNGCNLRPGDLPGSGTVSGPGREAGGCLIEMTRGGAAPVALSGGEKRCCFEDGD